MQQSKLRLTFSKLFNRFIDLFIISRCISNDEIIVRTLTSPKHISNSTRQIEPRKFTDFFLQYGGGVSVDRYRYTSENLLKLKAKSDFAGSQLYIGFSIFTVETFLKSLDNYIENYKNYDFTAIIIATPLDENKNEIENKNISKFIKGNLSHADIFYYENMNKLEQPNSSCRNFSRILASNAINILDENIDSVLWEGKNFAKTLKN